MAGAIPTGHNASSPKLSVRWRPWANHLPTRCSHPCDTGGQQGENEGYPQGTLACVLTISVTSTAGLRRSSTVRITLQRRTRSPQASRARAPAAQREVHASITGQRPRPGRNRRFVMVVLPAGSSVRDAQSARTGPRSGGCVNGALELEPAPPATSGLVPHTTLCDKESSEVILVLDRRVPLVHRRRSSASTRGCRPTGSPR